MENVFEYLPGCIIALMLELAVFFGFIYFVTMKTDSEVSRRWKAAAFIGVCVGVSVQLIVLTLVVLGWFIESKTETFVVNLSTTVISFFAEGIVIGATVTMPVVFIGLFIAYHYFWQTGDRLIEKYWRNPKIHYGANSKPPFLKF
jgi:hypothetical protein